MDGVEAQDHAAIGRPGDVPAVDVVRADGADRSLFATDAPFDPTGGGYVIGGAIEAVESLDISDAERQAVFAGNARELLKPD